MFYRVVLPIVLATQSASALSSVVPVSAVTSLSGLSYRLVDLDESDGMTPWVQFSSSNVATLRVESSMQGSDTVIEALESTNNNAPSLETYSSVLTTSDGVARSFIGQSTIASSVQVDAQALQAFSSSYTYDEEGSIASQTGFKYLSVSTYLAFPEDSVSGGVVGFVLAPNTALVLEGTFSVDVQIDREALESSLYNPDNGWQNHYLNGYYSVASQAVIGRYENEELQIVDAFWGGHSYDFLLNSYDGSQSRFDHSSSETFAVTFQNASVSDASGVVYFQTSAFAEGGAGAFIPAPPAIPEPSTIAMMLLGLGGIGAAARQRRLQQS